MRVAQRLYENGYITYMRTDSTTLSESALTAARAQAVELYGADSSPSSRAGTARKVKNAQEAHEAIRPAGDAFRTPKELERELNRDELALYDLIWKRTLASQMADARGLTVSLRLGATTPTGATPSSRASGTVITFRGFLAAYEESRDDADARTRRSAGCPHLKPGDELKALELEPEGHETTPPARYTEASLVQALEERGIGRPSTYASIIGTILDRGYVFKTGTALVPTFLAFAVTGLLEQHFGRLVDYDFTAQMEDDLDRIAAGERGAGRLAAPLLLRQRRRRRGPARARHRAPRRDRRARGQLDPDSATAASSLRVGRYGPYLERGEERASVPEDMAPDELTVEKAEELLSAPPATARSARIPSTGREIVGAGRPLRPVRDRGAARGRDREAAHRVALPVDVARDGHARRRRAAAVAAARARRRSGRRRGDRRPRTAATART